MSLLDRPEVRLGVSLGIGLIVGIERERRKGDGADRKAAGVRTFALVGLIGGVCAYIGGAVPIVGGVMVGVLAAMSYALGPRRDPGVTSEVALFLTFLLGVLAHTDPGTASALAVVVTLVLVSRERVHDFARRVLTGQELSDGLLLAASALVVLPLTPDRAIDPWGALNPRTLWRLVVLVMAISSAGYIAVRVLGTRRGLPLAGLAGGFVSSTATIGAMGQRASRDPSRQGPAIAAAALSTVATIALLALILAATSRPLLARLAIPLGAAGAAAVLYALVFLAGGAKQASDEALDPPGRAFRLRSALVFAALVATVLIGAAIVRRYLGGAGLLLASSLAGFADVHAATVSVATLSGQGQVDPSTGAYAVLLAISTNSLSKTVAAFAGGGRAYGVRVLPGLVGVAAAAWAALLLTR